MENNYDALDKLNELAKSDTIEKQMIGGMNQMMADMVIPGQAMPKRAKKAEEETTSQQEE